MDNLNSEAHIADSELVSGASEARDGAQDIGDALRQKAAAVAGKVQTKISEAGVEANQIAASAKDQANDLTAALINEIKARPVRAVLAAAVAGLVVGVLASR